MRQVQHLGRMSLLLRVELVPNSTQPRAARHRAYLLSLSPGHSWLPLLGKFKKEEEEAWGISARHKDWYLVYCYAGKELRTQALSPEGSRRTDLGMGACGHSPASLLGLPFLVFQSCPVIRRVKGEAPLM